MSSRAVLISLAALLALSITGAGCTGVDTGEQGATASPTPNGGDDDDDDDDGGTNNPTPTPGSNPTPTPTPPVGGPGLAETEPNDDHDLANPLGSNLSFNGKCGDTDFFDIFKIASVPAGKTVTATLTWTEGPNEDLDLFVSNYDYSLDKGDESIPPGDSPAQVTVTTIANEDIFIEAFCYWAITPNVAFTGTVTVQ